MDESQLTLGQIIKALKALPKDTPTMLRIHWDSYRGFYQDLAAVYELGAPWTVGELLVDVMEVSGSTYWGWKGGDFTMCSDTRCWRAPYGISTGIPLTLEDLTDGIKGTIHYAW